MAKIDKNITFSELMKEHPEAVEVLMEAGMHCIGCPASMFETLEQGAIAHGTNPDELVKKINNNIKGKKDVKKKETKKSTSNSKTKGRELSKTSENKSSLKDTKKKKLSEEEIEKKWKERMKNGCK
ncbi:MAG: DUF1858 domain-containing protein [archaeon]